MGDDMKFEDIDDQDEGFSLEEIMDNEPHPLDDPLFDPDLDLGDDDIDPEEEATEEDFAEFDDEEEDEGWAGGEEDSDYGEGSDYGDDDRDFLLPPEG